MIYEIWRRLLQDGVPQAAGFKLVFVGRAGWMIEELVQALARDPMTKETLLILPDVDDERLATLYQHAAFCLYPSVYEGYGLPVVEAFRHGKAVLTSSGGALPELVREFSPCIDPADDEQWYRILRHWIEDPSARVGFEQAIRTKFKHPTWHEAAAAFFALLDRPAAAPGAQREGARE
jgi:glycosyltransferase involved in cell wall biosynthesis